MPDVTPLEDAQAFVIGHCPPATPIDVGFEDAHGLVLAADVGRRRGSLFDNSAVDGYAVQAVDVAAVPV